MDNTYLPSLPPLPAAGETGPEVCAVVQMYLAFIDDLTKEQVELLNAHVAVCAACGEEFRVLERASQLVGTSVATAPSARVDAAIRAMIEGRGRRQQPVSAPRRMPRYAMPHRTAWIIGEVAVSAALILLAIFASTHFFGAFGGGSTQTAFTLPAHLSWGQYVLYHSETHVATNGEVYQVESYDDLGTGNMHVETKMDDQLDVIAVGNKHEMLGIDMIHHVAQMNADQWAVDDSLFNLSTLRHDLQMKNDVYLDTETYKGQAVYRIRCQDGLIMLLDMQYRPVNVLRGSGEPIYTSLQLIPASQVPSSMWDMSIPQGYQMGALPAKP